MFCSGQAFCVFRSGSNLGSNGTPLTQLEQNMTTTTTTEVQSKRDERMSDYRRDIDQLGELPNAEELARPIVKATLRAVNLRAFRLTQNEEGSGVFWGGLSSKKRPVAALERPARRHCPGNAKTARHAPCGTCSGPLRLRQRIRR